MHDTDFLLTKAAVSVKVQSLLSETHAALRAYAQRRVDDLPSGMLERSGKISRGENYRQLPYWILDYPRNLANDDVFALRTMFWWGHYFSITFQLGGTSWESLRSTVRKRAEQLRAIDASLCVNADPWQHHRGQDNYTALSAMTASDLDNMLSEQTFLKVAVFLSVDEWSILTERTVAFFGQMIDTVALGD